MADRPDLDALADRLDGIADVFFEFHEDDEADVRTVARILRVAAAAPGPLRRWFEWEGRPTSVTEWFAALADAVGEP